MGKRGRWGGWGKRRGVEKAWEVDLGSEEGGLRKRVKVDWENEMVDWGSEGGSGERGRWVMQARKVGWVSEGGEGGGGKRGRWLGKAKEGVWEVGKCGGKATLIYGHTSLAKQSAVNSCDRFARFLCAAPMA